MTTTTLLSPLFLLPLLLLLSLLGFALRLLPFLPSVSSLLNLRHGPSRDAIHTRTHLELRRTRRTRTTNTASYPPSALSPPRRNTSIHDSPSPHHDIPRTTDRSIARPPITLNYPSRALRGSCRVESRRVEEKAWGQGVPGSGVERLVRMPVAMPVAFWVAD
ncbi:uncharacterized protein K452DRAFT_309248 [Aplosporella prunicola CBS 121167]|uniref:Uncharacterized protein n=1 Tax=Aplosporella prunicola CBS 121167 TaxID=1176127 RepID=A0A6A6BF24_9PEZI|nr:uncharacterized protein K452DRAFT_309248 [Aplosporella prunicola CBS 121167]KAF2141497.1 hypothetical protein K452DRAFT_309248 [Aplosporella prunicola CBS 121167]